VFPIAQDTQNRNTTKVNTIESQISLLKGQPINKITGTHPYKKADVSTNHNKNKLMLPVLISTIRKNAS